jgi:hypothetical protein
MVLFGRYPTRVAPSPNNRSPNKPKKRSQVVPVRNNAVLNYSKKYVESYMAMILALQEFNSLNNSKLKSSREAQQAANFIRRRIEHNRPRYLYSLSVIKRRLH